MCFIALNNCLLSSLSQHIGNFFPLPLTADVCSQLSLGILEGTLILSDPKELSNSLLIRSKTSYLLDNFSDELHSGRKALFRSRGKKGRENNSSTTEERIR